MYNKKRQEILIKWISILFSGGIYLTYSCIGSRLPIVLGRIKGIESKEIIIEGENIIKGNTGKIE